VSCLYELTIGWVKNNARIAALNMNGPNGKTVSLPR